MKRIVAILISAILLITCATAFGEDQMAYYELELANTAIKAMTATIESLTTNMEIMAELLAEKDRIERENNRLAFENFAKESTELYNNLETMAFKESFCGTLQNLGKDIANQKPDITDDENGNIINDINEDDIYAFIQALAGTVPEQVESITPPDNKTNPIVGGWTITDDYTITDAMGNMVATATAELPDVNITPIACIGTQLVAGENFCYFCHVARHGEPDDEGTEYILLYIYVDLKGNAEILSWIPIMPGTLATMTE